MVQNLHGFLSPRHVDTYNIALYYYIIYCSTGIATALDLFSLSFCFN